MPFDVAGWQNTPKVVALDLSKPSLPALAALLRDKRQWPEGFTWNYYNPKHCAIGLGRGVWGREEFDVWKDELPEQVRIHIFYRVGSDHISDWEANPEHVAVVIEHYAFLVSENPYNKLVV